MGSLRKWMFETLLLIVTCFAAMSILFRLLMPDGNWLMVSVIWSISWTMGGRAFDGIRHLVRNMDTNHMDIFYCIFLLALIIFGLVIFFGSIISAGTKYVYNPLVPFCCAIMYWTVVKRLKS